MLQSQQDARVIMLSLEHAASGTNLIEATHIVLMDPVAGTPAEVVSVEQQAIGRAHRMGQNKQVCAVCLLLGRIKSNQIYLLKTHHISMQQVVKQSMSRVNKAQKCTYSDPKTTS